MRFINYKIFRSFGTQDRPKPDDFEWIIQQMCKWDNLELDTAQIKKISTQCTGHLIE